MGTRLNEGTSALVQLFFGGLRPRTPWQPRKVDVDRFHRAHHAERDGYIGVEQRRCKHFVSLADSTSLTPGPEISFTCQRRHAILQQSHEFIAAAGPRNRLADKHVAEERDKDAFTARK